MKNIVSEVFQYSLHVIKIFFGFESNYHYRHHKRRKLSQRLTRFMTVNHRSIDESTENDIKAKVKYPYPPNTN
jgi:hypothetical protein